MGRNVKNREMMKVMSLRDMVDRAPVPIPWDEGYTIPWDDPGFSERMLAEHLTQEHDAAALRECGFEDIRFFPSLTGEADGSQEEFFALVARKKRCR